MLEGYYYYTIFMTIEIISRLFLGRRRCTIMVRYWLV